MYELSLNNFTNINEKRFLFYKHIYDYFKNNKDQIQTNILYEYGYKSNMSKRETYNEIIGCIYAPFLIAKTFNPNYYTFCYNGRLRFDEFFHEGNYVEYEFPFTIKFNKTDILFRRFITDSQRTKQIEKLVNNKWSVNKSSKKLSKKVKNIDEYTHTLFSIIECLDDSKDNNLTYLDLINSYGKPYKNGKNISCNLYSRFSIKSNLIKDYPLFFKTLYCQYQKPIDWGGLPFSIDDINTLNKNYNNNENDTLHLIDNLICDGLIRFINNTQLTLTSTGYYAIKTYIEKCDTLQIIVRKKNESEYEISIGENVEFLNNIVKLLIKYGFINVNGWLKKMCTYEDFYNVFTEIYYLLSGNYQYENLFKLN